ncbi:hypothetical protein, partial [thiotrophic endosymbiont of Bathymodiolus puteoserpentis (Logatchev)]|uniref:hypothetical protein n=1 Tax=thiotrophic endosymbiont of Bathymodiolus puteoserpentis (Logatchev) TaxID=343240 RepID=UPI0010B75E78
EDSAIIRYATPILKDPSSAIKIVENGLKAIGVIAGAEIVNHVSDSAQDDVSDIPEIDDVSEVAGTGAPMPDGGPPEDWDKQKKGTPRGNKRQNKQFADATRGLTKNQKKIVHRRISGKNHSYQEIKKIAEQVKNKELW